MKKLLLLIFLACGNLLHGQNLDFGVHGGLALYSGDLSPEPAGFALEDLGPAGGIFLRWQMNKFLAVRPTLTYASLSSDDSRNGNSFRGVNFKTNIFELSGVLEISPFNLSYYNSNTVIVPYLLVGAGVFRFNPKATYNGLTRELQPLGTEGQGLPGYETPYSLTQINFPFGLGIKFVLNDAVTFAVELAGRKLQTDYLDDVSNASVRYGDLLDNRGPVGAQFSAPVFSTDTNPDRIYTRGGGFNDFYYITTLSVSYRFQSSNTVYRPGKKGIICPRF